MAPSKKQSMKLLIVEDDSGLQSQLRWCFDGYEILQAQDRASAMSQVRRHQPPLVTLDLGLPPDPANATEGIALLEEILAVAPQTKVIVVTGNDDRANALQAVALGAYDYYIKPVDADALRLIVDRAAQLFELEAENRKLAQQSASPLQGLISSDPGMLKICRMIERVAPSDATVLLLGESGTGKEVLARALHQLSPRVSERFVALNCAAIPENLLESELFGYEKGAFTGAVTSKPGRFQLANHGTIFLDEIGDLEPSLQAKLLQVLEHKEFTKLGGTKPIVVDVQIIAATNVDLDERIRQRRFRDDLYFRLNEVSIWVAPLAERREDIPLLVRHFVKKHGRYNANPAFTISGDDIARLTDEPWEGNVRELESTIKRWLALGSKVFPGQRGAAPPASPGDRYGGGRR